MGKRTITIHAGEASAAAEGRTYQQLAVLAASAAEASDYRQAHVLAMAATLVATTPAEAITGAGWALERAAVYQPDPLPPVPEVPVVQPPVLLDWGVPVYRMDRAGRTVAGPIYGPGTQGCGWVRSGKPPGWGA